MSRAVNRLVAHAPPSIYNVVRAVRCSIDAPYIAWNVRRGRPFILVYQQGRVASTSVFESLCALKLPAPIYHVHTISESNAQRRIEEARRQRGRIDRNLFTGRAIGREIARRGADRRGEPWKVVSIFRDPISVMMSLHFMNAEKSFGRLLDGKAGLEAGAAIAHFRTIFENDDPSRWSISTWYEDVFREELGIDVYEYEFDREAGYSIIDAPGFRVLLIRYEDMAGVFQKAVAEWLHVDPSEVHLERFHIHRDRRFDRTHDQVKKNLRVSRGACDRVYGTRFAKHFYSRGAIDRLTERWCEEEPTKPRATTDTRE